MKIGYLLTPKVTFCEPYCTIIVQSFSKSFFLDKVGRRTSFEVTVNGTVIHSKLATMSFPDVQETVSIVQEVEKGGEPKTVAKMQEGGGCTIL